MFPCQLTFALFQLFNHKQKQISVVQTETWPKLNTVYLNITLAWQQKCCSWLKHWQRDKNSLHPCICVPYMRIAQEEELVVVQSDSRQPRLLHTASALIYPPPVRLHTGKKRKFPPLEFLTWQLGSLINRPFSKRTLWVVRSRWLINTVKS